VGTVKGWVDRAEFDEIRASWRNAVVGRVVWWSDEVNLAACLENARKAAQHEGELQRLYSSLPPGDKRLVGDDQTPPLALQIHTAQLDQAHWREYAAHYRARLAERKPVRPVAMHDPRLPREPGDDDDEVTIPSRRMVRRHNTIHRWPPTGGSP
jgi:hypothetical protein